jgi:hypothetical protein
MSNQKQSRAHQACVEPDTDDLLPQIVGLLRSADDLSELAIYAETTLGEEHSVVLGTTREKLLQLLAAQAAPEAAKCSIEIRAMGPTDGVPVVLIVHRPGSGTTFHTFSGYP